MSTKGLRSVPDTALQKLRCCLCNNYLSHFPVFICKNIGLMCGRCPVLAEEDLVHNEAYEMLAKSFLFPCQYSSFGCAELNLPDGIPDHEETCTFRQYFCPMMPSGCCPWQGPSLEIFEHFERTASHGRYILREGNFEIDFTATYSENYIIQVEQHLFVVHTQCDSHDKNCALVWCGVSYVGPKNTAKLYHFQIELKVKGNDKKCYIFPLQDVHSFLNPNMDKNSAIEISSTFVNEELDNPANVICYVTIEKKPEITKPKPERSNSDVETPHYLKILDQLECMVCFNFMVPPIYQCETGHSMCGNCKSKVSECPSCKAVIKNTRNFSLEDIANHTPYPCKYREYDCDVICPAKDIQKHEALCKFGPYKCPFKEYNMCSWEGRLANLLQHVRHSHHDNYLDLDVLTIPYNEMDLDEPEDEYFVMSAFDDLFKIRCRYSSDFFYWSVQLIGPEEEASKYMFVLDVIDNTCANQRLLFKRPCTALIADNQCFTSDFPHIKLDVDLLEPFIDNDFTYRIQVVTAN